MATPFTPPALDTLEPIPQQAQPSPTPITHYSQGRSVGGPDEMEDHWTNQGYTATGKNLTDGVVAVNPDVYPLGTVLRDDDSGELFLAADRHGNKDPKVVDIYQSPDRYTKASGTRRFSVAGKLEKIPDSAEGVRTALAEFAHATGGKAGAPAPTFNDPMQTGYFESADPATGKPVRRPALFVRDTPMQPAETFTPPALDTIEPDAAAFTPPPVNSEAPASPGTLGNLWNSFAKGATSEGIYSGTEGASRAIGTSLLQPEDQMIVQQADGSYKLNWWKAFLNGLGETLVNYADDTASLREDLRQALPVDPEFADSYIGGIAQGAGQLAGTLPQFAIPGMAGVTALGTAYDQQYQDALAHGATPDQAHQAGLIGMPAGSLDYLADKLILGKILKPLRGKITVGDAIKHIAIATAAEGTTEGAQQVWQNIVAKQLAGYDPERPLDDEVIKSMIIGGIVGGGATGVGMAGSHVISPKDARALRLEGIKVEGAQPDAAAMREAFGDGPAVSPETAEAFAPVGEPAAPIADPSHVPQKPADSMLDRNAGWKRTTTFTPPPVESIEPETPAASPEPTAPRWNARDYETAALADQYRKEMEAELNNAGADTGHELLAAIDAVGGLPAKDSPHRAAWSGEMDRVLSAARSKVDPKGGAFVGMLFRRTAPDLDQLRGDLADYGFNFETENDLIGAIENRLTTGRKVYGNPASVPLENIPFSKAPATAQQVQAINGRVADAVQRVFGKGRGPRPEIVVHADAGAIPDNALRSAVLDEESKGKGVAQAFLNPADGKIHLIANRLSPDEVEAKIRHEGVHWALRANDKFRADYERMMGSFAETIKPQTFKELRGLYGNDPVKLMEEYMARLAETEPNGGTWRNFVVKIKAVLARYFPNVKFSEADIRAFLHSGLQRRSAMDKAKPASGTTLFSKAPEFYSQLERTLTEKMPNAASPDQVRAIIDPSRGSGVKPDEIKWSGVHETIDSLAASNGGKVPKTALLAQLRDEGGARFHEVSKSGLTTPPKVEWHEAGNATYGRVNGVNMYHIERMPSNGMFRIHNDPFGQRAYSSLQEAKDTAEMAWGNRNPPRRATQYENYQLPGGSNYRELVLAMPEDKLIYTRENVKPITAADNPAAADPDRFWYFSTPDGQVFQIPRKNHETQPEARDYIVNFKQPEGLPSRNYVSPHFKDIGNYVAHMRVNDRTDRSGAPGLFIEEIQSDRHQQARKHGYRMAPPTEADIVLRFVPPTVPEGHDPSLYPGFYESFDRRTGTMISRHPSMPREAIMREAMNWANISGDRQIADAPFRKDWAVQMFKRALRDAVATGKQWIGWTSGTTQNQRYDLANHVEGLRWHKGHGREDEQWSLEAIPKDLVEWKPIVGEVSPQDLENYVGKDAAAKLIAGTPDADGYVTLTGLDLEIGGDGMKGFYDNILPKEVAKYVKKWGGRVESSKIVTGEEQPRYGVNGRAVVQFVGDEMPLVKMMANPIVARVEADRMNAEAGIGTPVWRVDITPAMREGVAAGQPLFSKAPTTEEEAAATDEGERRRFIESVKRNANVRPEVKQRLRAEFYDPVSNDETVRQARARIQAKGLDASMADILAQNPETWKPEAADYATALEVAAELHKRGRLDDEAAIYDKMAIASTDQGRAIQFLSMMGRYSPEGIQIFAARQIRAAVEADPELKRLYGEIARLRDELAEARKPAATQAVLDVQKILAEVLKDQATRVRANLALRDALMQTWSDPAEAVATFKRLLEQFGITPHNADRIAKRLANASREHGKKNRAEVLKKVKTAGERRIPPGAAERLIILNREGKLDDAGMAAELAKIAGVPTWTPEMAGRARRLAHEYERATDPEVKLVLAARMLDTVRGMTPPSVWAKARGLQNLAMLLNPKTVMRNLGGNAVMWAADLSADTLTNFAVDPMISLVTGKRSRVTVNVRERFAGLAKPVQDFWNGYGHAQSEGRGTWQSAADGVQFMIDIARLTAAGKFELSKVDNGLRKTFSAPVLSQLEDTLALVLGTTDRAFHASAYQASLARQMALARSRGVPVLAPTAEMHREALMDAAAAIYQNDTWLAKAGAEVRKGFNRASTFGRSEEYGIGTAVLPFVQVPGSIATKAIEWSPAGFIRTAYEALRPVFARREFRQREFADAFSRAALGSGVWAAGLWLAKLGIMTAMRDEDKDLAAMQDASGFGAYMLNASALWRVMASGNWWTPQPPRAGDTLVSYNWISPNGVALAAGAQYFQAEREQAMSELRGRAVPDYAKYLSALEGGGQAFLDQSFLSGLADAAKATGNNGLLDGSAQIAAQMPLNFIPTIVRQVRDLTDNTTRETSAGDFLQRTEAKFMAAIPGLSDNLPARANLLGEAQERYQYATNSLFNVFLNPAFVKQYKADPELVEAERVYRATGERGVLPGRVEATMTLNGQTVRLTNEELAAYQSAFGQFGQNLIGRMIATPAWAEAPMPMKAQAMAAALRMAHNAAKLKTLGNQQGLLERARDQIQQNAAHEAELMGTR